MNGLTWQLLRRAGWARSVLVSVATGVATAIVLIAVTWLLLPPDSPEVFAAISEPGLRTGTVFGALLVTIAPLLLLDQVIRLGSAARERRDASLGLAGVTPGELRRLGLAEIGLPALVGALVSPLLVLVLPRADPAVGSAAQTPAYARSGTVYTFLPADPLPPASLTLAVIAAVTLVAVGVGGWSGRRVTAEPLGVVRRHPRDRPRPWGLVPLVAGVVGVLAPWPVVRDLMSTLGEGGSYLLLILVVVGLLSTAPWVAWRTARVVEGRTRDSALLLAARRIVDDPRPAARAGSALGVVFLGFGLAIPVAVDFVVAEGLEGRRSFYLTALAMVMAALLIAFAVTIGSLAVHSVESMTDRRRSLAALAALGVERSLLREVRRREILMVATPLSISGVLLAVVPVAYTTDNLLIPLGVLASAGVAAIVLVRLAAGIAIRVTDPWMPDLGDPAHLRTA